MQVTRRSVCLGGGRGEGGETQAFGRERLKSFGAFDPIWGTEKFRKTMSFGKYLVMPINGAYSWNFS